MRNFPKDRRGSAILIAILFSAAAIVIITSQARTIVQQYKSTVRYGLSQTAFHLSESGLELAMHAIMSDDLGSSDWASYGSNTWIYNTSETIYANYSALLTVAITVDENDVYTITSLTGIDMSGEMVESAVELIVKRAHSEVEEENNTGTGIFGYGLVARESIKINHNNPGMRISSYNSDNDNGVPNFGVNTGYDVVLATPSSNNYAIQINNAFIHGAVRSGGGTISYDKGYNNSNQLDQNATVIGPDSNMIYAVDPNRMSTDFDAEITDPELPTSDGYTIQNVTNQNDWKSNGTITIGAANTSTWINTERIDTNSQGTIRVLGDVVLNVQRNLNLSADVEIVDGATLTIMAGENIHINAEYIQQQHPSQLQVIAKWNQWGAPDVVLNSFKVFTGVINAPYSNVRLAGVGSSPKSQFRGAILGKYIEVTNGAEFYYDTKLGNAGDNDNDTDDDGEGVGDLAILHWAEIPPTNAKNTIYALF